jgi:hypothetical protein
MLLVGSLFQATTKGYSVKETTWSKLRELWAIRRRCKEIQREQSKAHSLPLSAQSGALCRMRLPTPVLACFSVCFLAACLLHVRDMWHHGWLPYHSAPLPLNCYWTALVILDLAAAVLLLTRPRSGLVMSLLVMSSDVAVNVFARFDLHLLRHARGTALLLLQLLFLAAVSAAVVYAIGGGEGQRA